YPLKVSNDIGVTGVTGVSDAQTGKLLYTIQGDNISTFLPEEQITTFGGTANAPTIVRWDITSSESARQLFSIPVKYPAFVDWGDIGDDLCKAVTVEENGNFHVWDVATGQEITSPAIQKIPKGHGNPIFSPNARMLANRNVDGTLSVLDTTTWNEILRLS